MQPRGAIFCDIDGTLIRHEDKPDYSRLPRAAARQPGRSLRHWIAEGYGVVLCTARRRTTSPGSRSCCDAATFPITICISGLAQRHAGPDQ